METLISAKRISVVHIALIVQSSFSTYATLSGQQQGLCCNSLDPERHRNDRGNKLLRI
ncbi:MAG: hypothetical protein IM486_03215 [Microcystis sp. M114S2]|uniref:hypothetical protein n=1 Tax=Microcystis TaxID=1125 RepID=UPI001562133C|nr:MULTISPECIES: hypothetical protein [Microcystis]NCR74241.1 hypothetical protein [Microcystis aeruginosa K13-06]MCA2665791.1 hypothetical protein [Microcystis sp. M045S2]MCA2803136.1 hypothetical protein [Microcystis sp. M114S2]MCA2835510.1 hypothetical protein [Microcystis sp. M007S1]MCA2840962.1 hypothetical protein [Microcystis sp. M079S1]